VTDLTRYAPLRIIFSGLWRIVFGAVLALPALAVAFALTHQSHVARSAADPPLWMLLLMGAIFGFVSLSIMAGGVGRIVSAFSTTCYFRAGPDGLAVAFPERGWLGRFRIGEYRFSWADIAQFVLFTYRINGIPSGTALHLRLSNGKTIAIERSYFSKSPKKLQQQLLALRAETP
jgi:hypothetical protein